MNRPELPSYKEILNDIIWDFENALQKIPAGPAAWLKAASANRLR